MTQDQEIEHDEEFIALQKLVGSWRGDNEKGDSIQVDYRLTASNSVLVETWTFPGEREALTLYHMDGAHLMATHYCPIGNQPRLLLQKKQNDGRLDFQFTSATNMTSMAQAHEHAFDLQIIDADTFVRNETYVADDRSESNGIRFARQ